MPDNIEKMLRFRDVKDRPASFNGYCLSHRIPEEYETKSIISDLNATINIINDDTVELAVYEWDLVLKFKCVDFHCELSGCEIYELEQ